MARKLLITLQFAGGGPWDGHAFAAELPIDESFQTDDGQYRLWEETPPRYQGGQAVAIYQWEARRGPDRQSSV